jgi:hypothetical protein
METNIVEHVMEPEVLTISDLWDNMNNDSLQSKNKIESVVPIDVKNLNDNQ